MRSLRLSLIVLASVAFWGLGMRGMMITVQGEDFMTLAQAKGLSKTRIFFSYAMRNAFLRYWSASSRRRSLISFTP